MNSLLTENSTFISNEKLERRFSGTPPLYSCDFSVDRYADVLYDSFDIVFPDRLVNAVKKRRAEFLVGRYCAVKSLSRIGVAERIILIGEKRNPVWPSGFIGSISHCSSQSIAVATQASDYLGIGVDVEDIVSANRVNSIQKQIIDNDEASLIAANAHIHNLLFTLVFSAKESFFKAAFPSVNRYFDFFAVSLVDLDEKQQKLIFRINETLHDKYLRKNALFTASYLTLSSERVITQVVLD